MKKGDKVKIISVSRGQQYDLERPIEIGAEGFIHSKVSERVYFLEMIDPLDGLPFRVWFQDWDLEQI